MKPVKYVLNEEFGIYVDYRGPDSWAVSYGGMCMDFEGNWDYEPSPSNRYEEWISTRRFRTPEAAEAAFLANKRKLRINGRAL